MLVVLLNIMIESYLYLRHNFVQHSVLIRVNQNLSTTLILQFLSFSMTIEKVYKLI